MAASTVHHSHTRAASTLVHTYVCMNMHTRVTMTNPLWPTRRLVFQESEIHLALVKKPDPQDDRVADSAVRGGADGWAAVR